MKKFLSLSLVLSLFVLVLSFSMTASAETIEINNDANDAIAPSYFEVLMENNAQGTYVFASSACLHLSIRRTEYHQALPTGCAIYATRYCTSCGQYLSSVYVRACTNPLH